MFSSELFSALNSLGFSIMKTIISVLWQSTILLGAVWLLSGVLHRKSPSVRFNLWLAAILIIPVLPILTLTLNKAGTPHKNITVIPAYTIPQNNPVADNSTNPFEQDMEAVQINQSNTQTLSDKNINEKDVSKSIQKPIILFNSNINKINPLDYPWALALIIYILAVISFVFWIIAGRLKIRNWILKGNALTDSRVIDIFSAVRKKFNLKKEFIIIESKIVPGPVTCRIFKPVILLPKGLIKNLSDIEIQSIAIHEISHIKRNDIFVFTIISGLRTLLFFQPLFWIAAREISYLAELSCDSNVVEITDQSIPYAEMLTRIAENMSPEAFSTELAAGFLFTKNSFFNRIKAILSYRKENMKKLSKIALTGIAAVVFMSLAVTIAFPLGEKDKTDGETVISGKVLFEGNPVSEADIFVLTCNITKIYFSGSFINDAYLDNRDYLKINKKEIKKAGKTLKDGNFKIKIKSEMINNESSVIAYIVAQKENYSIGWKNLDRNSKNDIIDIDLQKPVSISGIVVDQNGKPITDAEVKINYIYSTSRNSIVYSSSTINMDGIIPGTKVKSDKSGRFVLKNIPELTQNYLSASASGYSYNSIQSAVTAGSDEIVFNLAPEGKIEGVLTYSTDGKPVKNAEIIAVSASNNYGNAITDKNGKYIINKLPAGKYTLSIGDIKDWTAEEIENIDVKPGETTSDINLKLIKGGIISGRVTEKESGKPIPGCRVDYSCFYSDSFNIKRSTTTDKNGYYKFRAVPGKAIIQANYSSHSINYLEYLKNDTKETIVEEGTTFSDINFELSKGVEIKGFVHTPDGKPVKGVNIIGKNENTLRNIYTVSDSAGKFIITGLVSEQRLRITAEYYKLKLRARAEIITNPGVEIDMILREYKEEKTDIEGIVYDADGKPASGKEVCLSFFPLGCEYGSSSVAALSDKEGKFKITGLIVGERYELNVKNCLAKSDMFIVKYNMPPFEFRLSRADKWLAGTITYSDGTPIPGIRVIVSGRQLLSKETLTDIKGYYKIDGLVEDSVFVTLNANEIWYSYSNILTKTKKDFELPRGDKFISGKVTDKQGNPIQGAIVFLGVPKTTDTIRIIKMTQNSVTDSQGKFELKGLIHEKENIAVSYEKFGNVKSFNNIATNNDNALLVLEPDASVRKAEETTTQPSGPVYNGPYNTILFEGNSPIKIDGDLSDWSSLGIEVVKITGGNAENYSRWKLHPPVDENDLSATFRCFADDNYLYTAYTVKDDTLMVGNQSFEGLCGSDDTVLLWIYNKTKEAPVTYINITSDNNWKAIVDGRDTVAYFRSPYLLDAMGVKAGMKKTSETSYSVEYAIPWSFLNLAGIDKNSFLGLDAMIYDRDDVNLPYAMTIVEWAVKGANDKVEIKFTKKPGNGGNKTSAIPSKTKDFDQIVNIMQSVKEVDWKSTETKLHSSGNDLWVKTMLAMVLDKQEKRDESAILYKEIIEKSSDDFARWWAAGNLYGTAYNLKNKRQYNESIVLFQTIAGIGGNYWIIPRAKFDIAQTYFESGDYKNAKKAAEEYLVLTENMKNNRNYSRMVDQANKLIANIDELSKNSK